MQAFEAACSMTSSEQGDDLPGLLHNWGVGLSSMADQLQVSIAVNINFDEYTPHQSMLTLPVCRCQRHRIVQETEMS